MKVLITGATGLVGTAITRLCLEQKIEVNYLTTQKNKIEINGDCRGFYWDPKKRVIDTACFEGVTAIINLAGESISKRWTKHNKAKIIASRLDSLETLDEGLQRIDCKNITSFISASAIGIYPNSLSHYYNEDEGKIDESFLGTVVHQWEKAINNFSKFNFKIAVIRIGLVLTPEGGALPAMAKPINNYVGAAFGSGEQWQSWIHIDDLARQFLFLINRGLNGIYNGVAPNPVTNSKLVKEIAEVLKKPLFLPNIPESLMRLILGEMSYLLFVSQRVSSKKIEDEGFDFYYKNVCNALENLYQTEEKAGDMFHKEFV